MKSPEGRFAARDLAYGFVTAFSSGAMTTRTKGKDMKKAKLSLAWQIVIGLVLGVAIGALLNHFSAEKAWWISNVLQPAGDIFIRLIKMIVVPIVISSLIVGIAGVGDAKKLGSIGLKTIIYFEVVTTIAIVVGLVLANLFHPAPAST